MKVLLAVLAATCLVFAGCAGKSNTSSTASGTQTGTDSGSTGGSNGSGSSGTGSGSTGTSSGSTGTGSSGTGNGTNHAPVINTFSVNKTIGVAPLKVSFKLNATDADKDALTYILVFGDKSTNATGKLPSLNVTHTYAAKGNYTAKLFVSDGKLTVNKTALKVAVTAASAPPPTGTPLTWSGVGVQSVAGGCLTTDSDGNSYFYFDVALGGVWKFHVTSSVPSAAITTEWWAGDTHVADLGADGTVPAGADNVAVCGDVPTLAVDFELTISPT